MKRGTKITVFIASMALTVGSLIAIVGPRHHRYCGTNGHGMCVQQNYNNTGGCGNWSNSQADSVSR